ncbi:hypothetical protein AK830_g4819 [Neonectria ditissima]|uniref:DNA/RNA-binding domain-containing protein n=1 Tax=Neonectria ditissima TaxID=78410 RepID=A0A0N8H7G7_9HYPO|nr:hypothetical protein AK830_g4819 [Neonectria ditissima]
MSFNTMNILSIQCAHINQDEVAPLDAFQAHLPRNVDDAQQDTLYTATNPHIQQPHLTPETPPYGTDNRTSDLASLTTAVTSHPPAVLNVSIHVPQMAPNSTEKFQEEQFTSGNKGEKSGHDGNYQDSWSGTWSKAPTAISALGAVGIILVLSPDRKRKQRHSTPEVPDDGNKNDTADPYRDTSGPIDRKRIKLGHRTLQEAVERDQSYKCKPITVEQLIAEVKGIYAGLVMVETKCIEVDNTLAASDAELNSEQWQALVALHKTLLHEHHDFLLASQHPSASPALRRLARKYAMPARMWRHGIHSFLELLRHRLPHSLEHMLRFIYIAYTMMALLYETVPAYEDTWIECLGDLGRYRMAIEDEDIRDREVWTRVSSLCAPIPFLAARDSILTVSGFGNPAVHLSTPDATFLQAHAILFAQRDYENFEGVMESFVQCLEGDQSQIEVKPFISSRHPLALITCNSIVGYGDESRFLLRLKTESDLTCGTEATGNDDIETHTAQLKQLDHACTLAERIDTTLMLRVGDPDILEYLHVRLIFMLQMARNPSAMTYLSKRFPWDLAAMCLNAIAMSIPPTETFSTESFPKLIDEDGHVLSEDWEMRGLFWTENYFPEDWFTGEADFYSAVDGYKQPAPAMYREQRVLFVGRCLAQSLAPLLFDPELNSFISTLEEPPAESGLSISQNTKAEVSMVSMSEIGITVGELDTEGAVNLWLTQSTSLTRTRQEMSQPIAKQSDVAAISPTTSSVDKSTEITFEGPRRDFTCMATSENTEASSTHHTEENAVVATTSHSHGTKNNSLTLTTHDTQRDWRPHDLAGKTCIPSAPH